MALHERNTPARIGVRPLIAAALLLGFLTSSASAQEITWRYNYNTARSLAQKKGVPLMLDIGTDNCLYCDKLDATTLRHPAIVSLVNERFVPLKVHAPSNPSLIEALRIQAYPTVVLAAPDGKILATLEGYMEPTRFLEHLQRAIGSVTNPEWMTRDLADAQKAIRESDTARAIALLRNVLEDGKNRPVQVKARQVLDELEKQGDDKLEIAKKRQQSGQTSQAIEMVTELLKSYPGTKAATEAGPLLKTWMVQNDPVVKNKARNVRAREMLGNAREAYKHRQYLICLEHCEQLAQRYPDLTEGVEAIRLASEIKNNPEWLRQACETLSDRLGMLYLSLAETWLSKGQPQQAMLCLERVIVHFPGTRQADAAQTRLDQIRGNPTRPVTYKP